jgi:glycosyltransferase involved in cell wall biosynthesis
LYARSDAAQTVTDDAMKFFFVSTMNDHPWGGSEELWSQAALRLAAEGHQVRASVAHWPAPAVQLTELARQGIGIQHHPSMCDSITRRISNKLAFRASRAGARLRQFRPDLVILSQGHNAGAFHWARLCRDLSIPFVLIAHCNYEGWSFGAARDAAATAYIAARRVFCVSQKNLELLCLQLGAALPHAEVIRNPCKLAPHLQIPWPAGRNSYQLACVARLAVAAKGQDLLLEVLARPEWRSRPVELSLYGEGPDADALAGIVGQLSLRNVHFRGHVRDVSSIWSENQLLVLPSRYEGLPLALVEAMRCGRPAVVTDVGGNAELCVDGETGFVASRPTANALAEALERAWQRREEWRAMGLAASVCIAQHLPADPVGIFVDKLTRMAEAEGTGPKPEPAIDRVRSQPVATVRLPATVTRKDAAC